MTRNLIAAWIVVSLVIALTTTFMQVWPADMVINFIVSSDGKFYIKLAFLITWLLMLLPVVLPYYIYRLIKSKNKVPADLTGRTGIIIYRVNALQDAMYDFDILIDEEKKEVVSNGKSTYVDLRPGTYQLKVKTGRKYSVPMSIVVESSNVIKYKVTVNSAATFKFPPLKEGFLLVNPI